MLSTSVIKNVGQASHYFSAKDNYYTKEEGHRQSEWYGNGANLLNLTGEVEAEQFTALLEGKLPSGEQIGKIVDGELKHRAGWDLTFSAPKSVSILALIGGDKRLIEAHRKAVSVALNEVERSCSEARIKTRDGMVYQNTGNIIAALYHHDLSRAQDPQLHTHSVVMNITERQDGKWRSLASQIGRYDKETTLEVHGFIERVRNNKRYFGKVYEAELAYHVKELGYEIEVNDKTGVFEIVGVSKEVREFFSKRRNKIVQHMESTGQTGARAADVATLKTRESKKDIDRAILAKGWNQDAKNLGLNCQAVIEKSHGSLKPLSPAEQKNVQLSVDANAVKTIAQAAKELSVFKTTFALEEVITFACDAAIQEKINIQSLLYAINSAVEQGELISLANEEGKTILMAKATLEDEKKIIDQLQNTRPLQHTIASYHVENYLNQHSEINTETGESLKILFGNDRFVLLEGQSTKEAMIKPIIDIAKSAQLSVSILSPNEITSKQLAEDIKQKPRTFWEHIKALCVDNTINHMSVTQFISSKDDKIPDVLLIDNSHLLSANQMRQLLEWGSAHETKMLFLGNKNILTSQQVYVSLQHLIDNGMKTVSLKEKVNTIAADIAERNYHSVINKISGRIVEANQHDDRLHVMVTHYTNLHKDERENAFLVANNKQSVEMLNLLTHQKMKDKDKLGKTIETTILQPIFLTDNKAKLATTYQTNHVVRFNESYKSLEVNRGEYLHVVSHDKVNNQVILKKSNGKQITWHPDKIAGIKSGTVELFSEKEREVSVGEKIIFHRSNKMLQITKGEQLTVQSIYQHKLKLENRHGKSVVIDLEKSHHQHFDYGYAATSHSIAHEKPTCIIADLPTKSFHSDQRRLFQVLSQAKEVWIYTDDSEKFIKHLENKTGDRLNAHATLARAQDLKNNLHSLYDVLEKQLPDTGRNKNVTALSRKAIDAIDYALHHLAEREAGFTHKELMTVALTHALGNVSQKELKEASVVLEKAGILLRGNRADGTLWTTAEAVKTEREIVAFCNQDKGMFQPIASDELIAKYADLQKLHPEQIAAVKAITQTRDRVMAIQGYPGTGKTTMLATISDVLAARDILKAQGYELVGVAPTHTAVKELKSRGIEAQTLDSFILGMQKELKNPNEAQISRNHQIIVIDESSMVSNRKMLDVLKIVHDFDFRGLIATGDTRQLPSPEAGKPQALVQTQVETVHLTDIRRQNNPQLKQAVKETINYNFASAFNTLKDSIIEIPLKPDKEKSWEEICAENRAERVSVLVRDYFSYPKEERVNIQVITPGHDDRQLANALIRDQLKQEGSLNGKDGIFSVLTSVNLTQVERSHITNFEKGQVLRFNQNQSAIIKSGEYFTITDINQDHNLLTLMNKEGREIVWETPKSPKRRNAVIEVFKHEERDLQAGDTIRWSRSDKQNELFSAESATVVSINNNHVTARLANQKLFTFDTKVSKFQHWDHGYASTVYAVQGNTKQIILAHLESFRENLINQPAFLVALTRAVDTFRIYTDNIKDLLERIQKNTGVKLSSLEVIGEFPSSSSKSNAKQEIATIKKNKKVKNNLPRFDEYTVTQIKEGLNNNAEQIAVEFLGKPKLKGSNYLKFGSNKGSLVVTTKGTKQGFWNDFSERGGTNMLSFIQKYGNMTKQQALQYGAKYLGLGMENHTVAASIDTLSKIQVKSKEKMNQQFKAEKTEQKNKITFAKKLATQSQSAVGTLVEKYLKVHRGIDMQKIPDDIRYHPGVYSKLNGNTYPAMLVIARDENGKIKAVQATYLDPNTANKIEPSSVEVQKQTFGVMKGASVSIKGVRDETTLIAEGIETGLSLAKALPKANVKITLSQSNFLNIDTRSLPEKVFFCLDNDGKNFKENKIIFEASKRLDDKGKDVNFMLPTALGNKRQDYNDIIKHQGIEPIKQDYKQSISYNDFYGITEDKSARTIENMNKPISSNIKQKMEIKDVEMGL